MGVAIDLCVDYSMASKTNAADFSISDLADVLTALIEVSKPYQLGIQLKIDVSKLKTIEENYSKDIDRQRTEVIEYWLRNSPDASWTTLANAVERMGGCAKLVETLREKEPRIMGDTAKLHGEEEQIRENPEVLTMLARKISYVQPARGSRTRSLNKCVPCRILLLGKMGHGTSTLGNRILDHDGWFKINDRRCPQTAEGSAMISSASQLKEYKIEVYDHSGLFNGASSTQLSSAVPEMLSLAIFVLKYGSNFDVHEREILETVTYKWNIRRISALVLTHCERFSVEKREEIIARFKKDHPSIAELMGKGILAVGFPDSSHIQPGSPLSQRVEEDKANLRQLIYLCDEPVFIQNQRDLRVQTGVNSRQVHRNISRQYFCCSIL
jgi:hypothetical protein